MGDKFEQMKKQMAKASKDQKKKFEAILADDSDEAEMVIGESFDPFSLQEISNIDKEE